MSKINKGFTIHVQRRQGLRQRARMMFVSMAAEGRGEQEKGHKWPETLSSVQVLKVNGVPVKLTPMCPPPLQVKQEGYVMGCLRQPSVLTFISLMEGFRAILPTCCLLFLNIAAFCTL